MIMAWTVLLGLLIPQAHAHGAKDPGKNIPVPIQRLLIKVRDLMDQENYNGAIKLIRTARQTSEGKSQADTGTAACIHPMVCLALGNCYLMLPDYAQAESAYLAALDLAPDFMDARVNLARVYSDTSQFAKASQAFLAAYELSHPRQPDYLYYSAVMALTDGRTETAIGHFERLFAAHPDQVVRPWRENFANALMTANHWKRAVPVVRYLADHAAAKDTIKWQETLLQIFLQTNDLKQALSHATTLSREACTVPKWWKALVHINLGLGHYDRALDDLIIYGFLSPLTREEKKLFADLSLQLQIPARAVGIYETLLAKTQGSPLDIKGEKQMVQRLANAYRQLDQGDRALALLNRFDPKACDAELLLLKGDLLYEAKAFKAADEAYRMAARADCPRKGQAWLMAGYAAWQYNDLKGSRNAFEKAARFKRHRKDALAAMAQLKRTKQM